MTKDTKCLWFFAYCMGEDRTHIEISTDTRKDLRVYKAERGITYDEAIQDLLKNDE